MAHTSKVVPSVEPLLTLTRRAERAATHSLRFVLRPNSGKHVERDRQSRPDYSFPEHLERTQVLLVPMLGVGAREDGPP
jgi:hypothetical protein